MIDAFFAAVILFMGIGMVVSSNVSAPEETQTTQLSADLSSILLGSNLAEVRSSLDPASYVGVDAATIDYTLSPAQTALQWIAEECNLNDGTQTPLSGKSADCNTAFANAERLHNDVLDLLLLESAAGVTITIRDSDQEAYTVYNSTSPGEEQLKHLYRRQVVYAPYSGGVIGPATFEIGVRI